MNKILSKLSDVANLVKKRWNDVILLVMLLAILYLLIPLPKNIGPFIDKLNKYLYQPQGHLHFRYYLLPFICTIISSLLLFLHGRHLNSRLAKKIWGKIDNLESKIKSLHFNYSSADRFPSISVYDQASKISNIQYQVNADHSQLENLASQLSRLQLRIDELSLASNSLAARPLSPPASSAIQTNDRLRESIHELTQESPLASTPPLRNLISDVKDNFTNPEFFRQHQHKFEPLVTADLDPSPTEDGRVKIRLVPSNTTNADYLLFTEDNCKYIIPNPLGNRFSSSLSELKKGDSCVYTFINSQSQAHLSLVEVAMLISVGDSSWIVAQKGLLEE